MKAWLTVDLIAGAGAFGVAVAGVYLPDIGTLVDPRVAGAFSLVALGRWYRGLSGKPAK